MTYTRQTLVDAWCALAFQHEACGSLVVNAEKEGEYGKAAKARENARVYGKAYFAMAEAIALYDEAQKAADGVVDETAKRR